MCKGHRPGPSRVHTVKTESCRIGNMCTAQLVVVFAILLVLLGLGRRSVTPNPRPANNIGNNRGGTTQLFRPIHLSQRQVA